MTKSEKERQRRGDRARREPPTEKEQARQNLLLVGRKSLTIEIFNYLASLTPLRLFMKKKRRKFLSIEINDMKFSYKNQKNFVEFCFTHRNFILI